MKPVTREDLPRVLDCLEKDLPRCLYLYADIWVYGLDNPHMKVWFQEDGAGVRKVAMEYHSSFQLWGDRDFGDTGDFLELIRSRAPRGISARREIVEALASDLPDFTAEYGFVVEHRLPPAARLEARLAESGGAVCQAGEEDALEIAALICADPELGAQYTVEGLAAQLRERMATGMGRSCGSCTGRGSWTPWKGSWGISWTPSGSTPDSGWGSPLTARSSASPGR